MAVLKPGHKQSRHAYNIATSAPLTGTDCLSFSMKNTRPQGFEVHFASKTGPTQVVLDSRKIFKSGNHLSDPPLIYFCLFYLHFSFHIYFSIAGGSPI